jgi:hypothetical protein
MKDERCNEQFAKRIIVDRYYKDPRGMPSHLLTKQKKNYQFPSDAPSLSPTLLQQLTVLLERGNTLTIHVDRHNRIYSVADILFSWQRTSPSLHNDVATVGDGGMLYPVEIVSDTRGLIAKTTIIAHSLGNIEKFFRHKGVVGCCLNDDDCTVTVRIADLLTFNIPDTLAL